MSERLPARLEVTALLRRTQADGGFGVVLRRGDPDRGEILVHVTRAGRHVDLLERRLSADYTYRWTRLPSPEQGMASYLADKARIDPDCWAIELDIPDAERFVAEMTAAG